MVFSGLKTGSKPGIFRWEDDFSHGGKNEKCAKIPLVGHCNY